MGPFQFGIEEGAVESVLVRRGFLRACNVTSEDYRQTHFTGKNENKDVCSLYAFAHAVV